MAWPPSTFATNWTNTTPSVDAHAARHNAVAQAFNDLVTLLGNDVDGTFASLTARLSSIESSISTIDTSVTSTMDSHQTNTGDPHSAAKYAQMPDGGNNIWTRSTDPAGLASEGDLWMKD